MHNRPFAGYGCCCCRWYTSKCLLKSQRVAKLRLFRYRRHGIAIRSTSTMSNVRTKKEKIKTNTKTKITTHFDALLRQKSSSIRKSVSLFSCMHTNKLYLPTITDTCIYIHTSYIFDNRSIDSKYRLEQMNKYLRISSTSKAHQRDRRKVRWTFMLLSHCRTASYYYDKLPCLWPIHVDVHMDA